MAPNRVRVDRIWQRVANMASYDKMIIGTNHIVLACLYKHF
jgi:hypothetical protein